MNALNERAYMVIDELLRIARELDTTPARMALAWVQSRPGVTSTILGARTLSQLDDNLAALELRLGAAQIEALDAVSKPTLNFPADFLGSVNTFAHAGATVNGEPSGVIPFVPSDDSERY
jgi:diketogulonate reductase-like aldo/keto reductase